MKSYEIQVLDKGSWLTDSVYDDRVLAESQARQMDGNSRFGGIRVVEEIFHDGAEKSVSRIVYRDADSRRATSDRISDSRQSIRANPPKPAQNKQVSRVPRGKVARRAAPAKSTGMYWAIGLFAALAALGGGAFVLL